MQTTGETALVCACRVTGCAGRGDGGGCLLKYGWHLGSDLWWHAPAAISAQPGGGKFSYPAAITATNAWLKARAQAEATQEMPVVTVTPPAHVKGATSEEIREHLDLFGVPGVPPNDGGHYLVEWQGRFFVSASPAPPSTVRHAPLELDAARKLSRTAEAEEALRRKLEELGDRLEDMSLSARNRDDSLVEDIDELIRDLRTSLDEIEVSDAALELLETRARRRPGG